MAYSWGGGQFGNRQRPNKRISPIHNSPRLRLRNYEGPYDHSALAKARDDLIYHIERMQDTTAWYRIQRKTDVNIYEIRDLDDGFGDASTAFSHAGLAENLPEEESSEEKYSQPAVESPYSLPEKSTESVRQSTSATVTNDNSEVDLISIDRASNENSFGSDVVILGEEGKSTSIYNLESDGIEIVRSIKPSDNVVFIEDEEEPGTNVQVDNQTNIKKEDIEGENGGNLMNMKMNLGETGSPQKFKCDFCDYVSDAKMNMQEHLNKAVHLAASEYSLDESGIMKLKRSMVLLNCKAKFKTVLAVCPCLSCLKVFPHIHMCVEHYNMQHVLNKNERNQYGLINIVKEEDCINAVEPKQCHVCFKQFDSRPQLNNHFKDCNHYPYTEVKNCQKMFFCFYCKSKFDTFESITLHQERAHKKVIQNGALQFTVFHYRRIQTHKLVAEEEITSTSNSDPAHTTESSAVQGTSQSEPDTGIAKSDMEVGTSKRKHDGSHEDMEPRIKTSVNNEYASRSDDENMNNIPAGKADGGKFKSSLSKASFTMSAGSGDSEDITNNQDNLSELFKCDYCLKTAKDKNQMYLHLVQEVHRSASTVMIDEQGNIVYLKETGTVQFEGASFKKVVAACQENNCGLLFDSIYLCDEHNAHCHNSKNGFYHLVDIVDRVPVEVAVDKNLCMFCGVSFKTCKMLYVHYLHSNHLPFTERSDCNVYTLCCYCKGTFSSYITASNHVKSHKKLAKNGMLNLIVLFVSKTFRKYDLPPYQLSRKDELTCIRSKIANLR